MREHFEVIRRLVGEVPVTPLATGLDHRVYAVGDGLVARFGPGAGEEAALLAAVAPRVPLPVPVPLAVDAAAGCLVLPRVCGVSLLERPSPERGRFASAMADFVAAVHVLQWPAPLDETPPSAWLAEARETWPRVRDLVPGWVEAFLENDAPASVAPCFIHGDLGAEHVFVDGDEITGVIDWGDAALGDPAVDHGRLMRDFDLDFGERARFYAICTALEDVAYGREPYVTNAVAALERLART
ncbi:aminoglycoside phosphotransferase family protein [Solirubrobacter phytolaccae]|uniref:Aminoglycoside phosphotransferase family protein n=1 Tax=Solirubrobacter phytolaccae TaxID=1404360 RepID=A0A9X3S9S3_9ACTN|nr:aminoglycoside phosphotransferase family protein [Solirubrobacter phytolaccae]MDA0183694.1 aminoglycoside phosphotransferase family protein [Solirubrobacter phytolaccae]